jgi:hypothetical protein
MSWFHGGAKDTKSHKAPNFIKEKGKAPMDSNSHSSNANKNHAFIYADVNNVRNVHHDAHVNCAMPVMCHDAAFIPHAMIASTSASYAHGRSRPRRLLMCLGLGLHLMALLCYIVHLVLPMCFVPCPGRGLVVAVSLSQVEP